MSPVPIPTAEIQSRFAFPFPTRTTAELRKAICWLMLDGRRRSVLEIQDALGTRKEIGARIRELRSEQFGDWPFKDARSDGPDPDGAFRYQLDLAELTWQQRSEFAGKGETDGL